MLSLEDRIIELEVRVEGIIRLIDKQCRITEELGNIMKSLVNITKGGDRDGDRTSS